MIGADEAPEVGGGEAVEAEAAMLRDGDEDRKWLLAINKLTERLFTDDDLPRDAQGGRIRLAYDRFLIAAFERAARILRSDLPDDRG